MSSPITKVTIIVEADGANEIAALGFQGFEPDTHDVERLFGVVKDKVANRQPGPAAEDVKSQDDKK